MSVAGRVSIPNNTKTQRGMTLTESLLVLLVGALAASIAYGGYRMALTSVKSSSQIKSTVQLSGAIKRSIGPSSDFAAATTANVISSILISDDFRISGAVVAEYAKGAATFSITTG